jgi:hypothetical protein
MRFSCHVSFDGQMKGSGSATLDASEKSIISFLYLAILNTSLVILFTVLPAWYGALGWQKVPALHPPVPACRWHALPPKLNRSLQEFR